jgi:hypothetical protein
VNQVPSFGAGRMALGIVTGEQHPEN